MAILLLRCGGDTTISIRLALSQEDCRADDTPCPCTAANRFYAHIDVAERFQAPERARGRPAGRDRFRPGYGNRPLVNAAAVDTVTALVESRWLPGPARNCPPRAGPLYPPIVLTDVPAADVVQQEIFGPVASIVTWSHEDELLRMVNESELGLAAYVYTGNLQHAIRLGEAVDAGMIGVNRGLVSDPSAPFGGVKQSGLGPEGARAGIEEYTETQYLSLDWPS